MNTAPAGDIVKVDMMLGNAVYIDGITITNNRGTFVSYKPENIEKTFHTPSEKVIEDVIRVDPSRIRYIDVEPYLSEARKYTMLWPKQPSGSMSTAKRKKWTPVVLFRDHKNYLFIKRYIIENCRFVVNEVKRRNIFGTNITVAHKIWLEDTKSLTFLALKYEWDIDLAKMGSVRSSRERRKKPNAKPI